ncbi:MAG: 50S ribosomal protein L17 [Candidatus Cloacimonetes bacterium]|nr:50S ribosomal protein L17 [Candidatus Cloacimonadota bacterium]
MRHHRKGTTSFGRLLGQKKALLNNLVKSLLENERIETTHVRAKETGRLAEKLITYGKKDTVHSRRQAYKILKDRDLVKKLFDEIAPQFKNRNGGYTRVIKTGFRIGDAAPTAIVEFVEEEVATKKKKKSKVEKPKTAKKPVDKKKEEKPAEKVVPETKEEVEEVAEEVVVEPEEEKVPETVEPEIEEDQEDLEEAKEEVEEALNEEVTEDEPVETEEEVAEEKVEEEEKVEPEPEKKEEPQKEEKSEEVVDKEKSK